MSPRRAPGAGASRWLPEALSWLTAVVLAAGVVTAVSLPRSVAPPAAAAEDPTPVVTFRDVVTRVPVSAAPAPRRGPAAGPAAPRARAVVAPLGPPPGPQYDPPPAQVAPPEARFALLVGVTAYPSPTRPTIGSANDARLIAGLLERSGWLPQNIRVLTDGQATGTAVRQGLTWLRERSAPGTFTLFHYSGHVKQVGPTVKLWPVDRDFLPETEVAGLLRGGGGKLWVDIAGCEAGGFQADLPSSRVLFTGSSTEQQKSYEYPDWGMSVWTGLLFDLAQGQGAADADRNGAVTIGEAIRYASYYAAGITAGQRPYGPQTPVAAGDPVRGWTLDAPPA